MRIDGLKQRLRIWMHLYFSGVKLYEFHPIFNLGNIQNILSGCIFYISRFSIMVIIVSQGS